MNKGLLQLTGILICVSLAFAANNVFVYVVSVLVIATLITDLVFLENLMAIIWKNGDYFKAAVESKKIEESKSSQVNNLTDGFIKKEEIQSILENYDEKTKSMETTIASLTDENEKNKIYLHYEITYRLIFGSQLRFLELLRNSDGYAVNMRLAAMAYRSSPVYPSYPHESFFGYMQSRFLIGYDNNGDGSYYLTQFGNGFLRYLEDFNISKVKQN